MSVVKLFMCCHKPFRTVPALHTPIQCGSVLNPLVEGALPDGIGDNISEKNREYCELTACYYAWKNEEADFYGFCHYRRFFCADSHIKKPYLVRKSLTKKEMMRLLGNEEYWNGLLKICDIVATRSEDMGIPVKEHYCTAEYHYAEDLELFLEILQKKAPALTAAAEEYLAQRRQYFCNMFVMRRDYFFAYCNILFSVLEEFDERKNFHDCFQANRTDGYLGEIFTGIYINYCRKKGAEVIEVPRIDNECSMKKRLGYILFPPESQRRFFAKKIAKQFRKNT